jgi:hypothetical protein
MVMVAPVPAAMADPFMMIIRVRSADMDAHIADMGACADPAGPRARADADRTNLNAGANLGLRRASEANHNGQY